MKYLVALLLFCSVYCRASVVVIWTTNSSTMAIDTNDLVFTPLSNIQNADGSYNTVGPTFRLHNPTGYMTNYFIANTYYFTNRISGFWDMMRVPDSSSNQVTEGSISLHQNANAFVTLIYSNQPSVFWNSSTNQLSQRPASELWVFPVNTYNQTNHPYSLITTN